MNNIRRPIAVITGASSGMGRAIATRLARDGFDAYLLGRNGARLQATADAVEVAGGHATLFRCDFLDLAAIEETATRILASSDQIAALVNCAGVWHGTDGPVYQGPSLQDTPQSQVLEVMQVTLTAHMLLTRRLLPAMTRWSKGKIINISGTFESGASGWLHYFVAKQGLEAFSIGLSQELRQSEVQVNTVSPSDTYTEAYAHYFPSASPETCAKPEEVADAVSFLASARADSITGMCLVVRSKKAR